MVLRNYHDILRSDVHQLKSPQNFQDVGEHDNRLAKVDRALDGTRTRRMQRKSQHLSVEQLGQKTNALYCMLRMICNSVPVQKATRCKGHIPRYLVCK